MYHPGITSTEPISNEWEALDALLFDLDALSIPLQRRGTFAILKSNARRKRCRVPGCLLKNCNLGTHQTFNLQPFDQLEESSRRALGRRAAAALRQIELYGKALPPSEGVDGFPTLPIEETLEIGPRSLFHFFFTQTFDKLARLFRGPSVSNLVDFKQRMLATALASEPYCRSLILHAQNEQDVSRGEVEESPTALTLHTKTLVAFRAQIALINEKPHPLHIELALLVLCILLTYDYVHDCMDVLKVHWQGMRDLVTMRGGIHCVTMAVAYVLQVDRLCGVFIDEMPAFINPSPESVVMPLLRLNSPRYGTQFRSAGTDVVDLDPTVLEYLADVSELVEMWENARMTGQERVKRGAEASPEYFHYSRDRLDEQFAILNAQWAQTEALERCLLWASRIVEYPCTWANYTESMTRKLCRRLSDALQQYGKDILTTWLTKLNILRWTAFALLMNVSEAGVHTWLVELLRKAVDVKYNGLKWPDDWWMEEQTNLQKFVWSNLHYSSQFRVVCGEIGQDRCESSISTSGLDQAPETQ